MGCLDQSYAFKRLLWLPGITWVGGGQLGMRPTDQVWGVGGGAGLEVVEMDSRA